MRRVLLAVALCALLSTGVPSVSAGLLPDTPMRSGLVKGLSNVGALSAVPLSGPAPRWYTPALQRRVTAAGPSGVPLPQGASVPQAALSMTGIRPGSWMISPAWCTLNFVFGSGTGPLYIGTAGHCARAGEQVTIVTAPNLLLDIGTVVKSVDNGVGDDFALIEIHPAVAAMVDPEMGVVGGPNGSAEPRVGGVVFHVGHGVALGTGGTPRPGVVTVVGPGENAGTAYSWVGASTQGDSGSPVRTAGGAAVGNLSHLVVSPDYLPGVVAGTTIGRMQEIAGVPVVLADG